MSIPKPVVLCILLPFLGLTGWALATGGSLGEILATLGATPWFIQVSADLVVALSLVCVWIWRDASGRGASPLPWIAATLFVGSIAPLAYLLARPESGPGAPR